jgi:uncharacterized protein with NRDE domain
MCLIVFAWQSHPQYPLVVAANRDEFHARPTAAANFWHDYPHILAGRDLEQGGTWLGISTHGQFSALTNMRDPHAQQGTRSRGFLVRDFLTSTQSPEFFYRQLQSNLHHYSPFNLLLGDSKQLYYTNHLGNFEQLTPGVYALSNAGIDTPWPKAIHGKQALVNALYQPLNHETLFDVLADTNTAADNELPDTGVGLILERMLSARFIISSDYGTRCSTLVSQKNDGTVNFIERQFDPAGCATDTTEFTLITGTDT